MGLARAVAREQFFNALVTGVWSGIVFRVCERVFAGGRGCVRVGALSFSTRTADDAPTPGGPTRHPPSTATPCGAVNSASPYSGGGRSSAVLATLRLRLLAR